jgi:hypothetical protein
MALRRCLPKSTAVLAVVGLLSMCLSHSTAFILPARTPQPPKATSITSSSKSLAPSRTDSISRNQVKWYRVASVLALILLPNTHNSPAHAFDAKGARLFENNCASCHVAGTNIIGWVTTTAYSFAHAFNLCSCECAPLDVFPHIPLRGLTHYFISFSLCA